MIRWRLLLPGLLSLAAGCSVGHGPWVPPATSDGGGSEGRQIAAERRSFEGEPEGGGASEERQRFEPPATGGEEDGGRGGEEVLVVEGATGEPDRDAGAPVEEEGSPEAGEGYGPEGDGGEREGATRELDGRPQEGAAGEEADHCGNGLCESPRGESCESCPLDCPCIGG